MMKTPKFKSRFHQPRTNDTSDLRPINPNAAGIDIGSESHWVSVPKAYRVTTGLNSLFHKG